MSRVRVRSDEDLPWIVSRDNPRSSIDRSRLGEGELSTRVRIREGGSDSSPQLIELLYEPNAKIQLHAHDEDEIIFVREGEIVLGNKRLGPGASIYVAGGTLYGFSAGPNGLQILNFRPRQDFTFITESEFRERKAKSGPA